MAFIIDDHGGLQTYMAIVVQLVVGELELVEGDHLLHPLGALGQLYHKLFLLTRRPKNLKVSPLLANQGGHGFLGGSWGRPCQPLPSLKCGMHT